MMHKITFSMGLFLSTFSREKCHQEISNIKHLTKTFWATCSLKAIFQKSSFFQFFNPGLHGNCLDFQAKNSDDSCEQWDGHGTPHRLVHVKTTCIVQCGLQEMFATEINKFQEACPFFEQYYLDFQDRSKESFHQMHFSAEFRLIFFRLPFLYGIPRNFFQSTFP